MASTLMLLRVRIPSGSTLKLRVASTLTYSELLSMAAAEAGASTESCELSLNRENAIPRAAPGISLAQLGLAHGDLVYLMDRTIAAAPPAAADDGFTPTQTQVPATHHPINPTQAAGDEPSGSESSTMHDARALSLVTSTPPRPPTTLVPQGLVDAIASLLAASGADGPHEPIVVALHVLLHQCGFVPLPAGGSDTAARGKPGGAALPPTWRVTAPALYSLRYAHARAAGASTEADGAVLDLKAVPMGTSLLVHAMTLLPPAATAGGTATLIHWEVRASDHALSRGGESGGLTLLKLPRLVHTASTTLVQPLLDRIGTAAAAASGSRVGGVSPGPRLLDLCPELKFAILVHVADFRHLVQASGTCAELRRLALDDLLWHRLYEARFGDPPPWARDAHAAAGSAAAAAPTAASAAAAFRRRHQEELRAAREAERSRRAAREAAAAARFPPGGMPMGPWPGGGDGMYLGGMPYGGGMVPGILGGDFDRIPGGGLPPPFGPNPFGGRGGPYGGGGLPFGGGGLPAGPGGFLPPGAVPPGARHDLISPLLDPDGMSGMGGGLGGGMGGKGRGRGRGGGRGGFFPTMPGGGGGFDGWDPAGGML